MSTDARITTADIEANIAGEYYFTAGQGAWAAGIGAGHPMEKFVLPEVLAMVTFCVLILRNGYKIVGVNEGPVSAANFDPAEGRKYAREKAVNQIWPLMGYELKSKLATPADDFTLPEKTFCDASSGTCESCQ